jgi:hypothetical protein
MGMPSNAANANGKANAPGIVRPLLEDFVGFVRTDILGVHCHA